MTSIEYLAVEVGEGVGVGVGKDVGEVVGVGGITVGFFVGVIGGIGFSLIETHPSELKTKIRKIKTINVFFDINPPVSFLSNF